VSTKPIQQVLKEHTPRLMSLTDVVGTAQGLSNDKPCIKVFVAKMSQQVKEQVPDMIEGYEVIVEVTGLFRAF